MSLDEDWQHRVDAVWTDATLDDDARTRAIDALADEVEANDPVALFERAGARDSAGREREAEPLYRAALAGGLDPQRRTRATIQLASTLRNLGKVAEARAMLEAEYAASRGTDLADESAAFLALALASDGDTVRGLSIVLRALAPHLRFYQRSVTGYAKELVVPTRTYAHGEHGQEGCAAPVDSNH